MRLTRRLDFCASHRLERSDWEPERNRTVFGPEPGTGEFGHNYRLEVTVGGVPDPETGMVIDLKWLKQVLVEEVEERFDHRNLNDDTSFFRDRAPTPEQFALLIFELLERALPDGLLHQVRLSPAEDCFVDVTRDAR